MSKKSRPSCSYMRADGTTFHPRRLPRKERRPNTASERTRSSMLMTLCPGCRASFLNTPGYHLIRADRYTVEKDLCTLCSHGHGFDYYVYTEGSRDEYA